MSMIKRYPLYFASADGENCGHQHRTLQAAANCAGNQGTVYRLDELGTHQHAGEQALIDPPPDGQLDRSSRSACQRRALVVSDHGTGQPS